MSDNTNFGIVAIVGGIVLLLASPLILDANARSVRKSKIFRGRLVDGGWATYNRVVIYFMGTMAILAGLASLSDFFPSKAVGTS